MDREKLTNSQNFIMDKDLVKKIVGLFSICKEDTVLEIGPGRGAITEELVKGSKRVIAVEADPLLFVELKNRNFPSNLEVYLANFLAFDLPGGKYKVFSNIPFGITSKILNRLLFSNNPPQ